MAAAKRQGPGESARCAPARAQVKDRLIVAQRMKAHVQAPDTTPLLIFPEGTCVNNEYCVMFKRGAFDLGATVCPVAIKYNKIFVDAFWNSKRQSFTAHLVRRLELAVAWRCMAGFQPAAVYSVRQRRPVVVARRSSS